MNWGRYLAKLLIAVLYSCASVGAAEDDGCQASYDDIPVFGGPEGVSEELRSADEIRTTRFDFDSASRLLALCADSIFYPCHLPGPSSSVVGVPNSNKLVAYSHIRTPGNGGNYSR